MEKFDHELYISSLVIDNENDYEAKYLFGESLFINGNLDALFQFLKKEFYSSKNYDDFKDKCDYYMEYAKSINHYSYYLIQAFVLIGLNYDKKIIEEHLLKAFKLNKDEAALELISFYETIENKDIARKKITAILKEGPFKKTLSNIDLFKELGSLYEFGDYVDINYDKAIEAFNLYLEYRPNDADALFGLHYCYYQRCDKGDYIKGYQAFLKSAVLGYSLSLKYLINEYIKERRPEHLSFALHLFGKKARKKKMYEGSIALAYFQLLKSKKRYTKEFYEYLSESIDLLNSYSDIDDFNKLFDEVEDALIEFNKFDKEKMDAIRRKKQHRINELMEMNHEVKKDA